MQKVLVIESFGFGYFGFVASIKKNENAECFDILLVKFSTAVTN